MSPLILSLHPVFQPFLLWHLLCLNIPLEATTRHLWGHTYTINSHINYEKLVLEQENRFSGFWGQYLTQTNTDFNLIHRDLNTHNNRLVRCLSSSSISSLNPCFPLLIRFYTAECPHRESARTKQRALPFPSVLSRVPKCCLRNFSWSGAWGISPTGTLVPTSSSPSSPSRSEMPSTLRGSVLSESGKRHKPKRKYKLQQYNHSNVRLKMIFSKYAKLSNLNLKCYSYQVNQH